MKVIASIQDTGCTYALLPVLQEAERRYKWNIKICVPYGSSAARILEAQEIPHRQFQSAEEVRNRYSSPDLLLTSTGSTIGRDLSYLYKGVCPRFVFQYTWGAKLIREWEDPRFWPTGIIVNDVIDKKITQRAWKGYDHDRIYITPSAAWDAYARGYA